MLVSSGGSAGKEKPIGAAKDQALFRKVNERVRQDKRVTRKQDAGRGRLLVEVELSSPSMLRQLGSLTERHGMRMYLELPLSASRDRARVSVAVPRAQTLREAEEVVASFLEWIRHANSIMSKTIVRPGAQQQREGAVSASGKPGPHPSG